MKTPKRKKNDRAAFFNLSSGEYFNLSQKRRRAWLSHKDEAKLKEKGKL